MNDYKKEHDLEVLLNTLKSHFPTETIRLQVIELADYYVATRYPGIEESELTPKDAVKALESAEKILSFIRKQIDFKK